MIIALTVCVNIATGVPWQQEQEELGVRLRAFNTFLQL